MKILSKSSARLSFSIFLFPLLFAMPISFADTKKATREIIKEENVPNDVIDNLYEQANGRLSVEGALFIRANFVYHVEPCRRITEDGGALWRCVYSSGLVVYNCFRKCRGSIEAANYFLGISGGDCDAFTIVNNQRKSVCYPKQATDLFRFQGQVVAIQRFRSCL